MTEPLVAELLKDLGGLGKPPPFDGNETEYQELHFSFRLHMNLVSAVSRTLVDKCEAERNQITVAAVEALGEAHLKCCVKMYYSLALITNGNVPLKNPTEQRHGVWYTADTLQTHRIVSTL